MRDMYQQVTDRIVAELQKGAAPWRILGARAGYPFPANAVTGRPYSAINVLILWMEETAGLPRYLTYNQASQAGDNVRKGEDRVIPVLRTYTVFHTSQCENLPERTVTGERQVKIRNRDARDPEADAFLTA